MINTNNRKISIIILRIFTFICFIGVLYYIQYLKKISDNILWGFEIWFLFIASILILVSYIIKKFNFLFIVSIILSLLPIFFSISKIQGDSCSGFGCSMFSGLGFIVFMFMFAPLISFFILLAILFFQEKEYYKSLNNKK